jgi:hypothetical protein
MGWRSRKTWLAGLTINQILFGASLRTPVIANRRPCSWAVKQSPRSLRLLLAHLPFQKSTPQSRKSIGTMWRTAQVSGRCGGQRQGKQESPRNTCAARHYSPRSEASGSAGVMEFTRICVSSQKRGKRPEGLSGSTMFFEETFGTVFHHPPKY